MPRPLPVVAGFLNEAKGMIWIWLGFIALVLLFLALDLGVFHRKAHVVSVKEALIWSGIWIFCGLAFGAFVYFGYERNWMGLGRLTEGQSQELVDLAKDRGVEVSALSLEDKQTIFVDRYSQSEANPHGLLDGGTALTKYITGYVVEKSLSVDNIFVIAMIFGFFAVPAIYQHRVLFWGILGALVMRGIMIAVGAQLIAQFTWILYLFGAFLIFTGIKMLLIKSHDDPSKNIIVRWVKKFIPVTDKFHGEHFFVRAGTDASHEAATPDAAVERDEAVERMEKLRNGALMMTPLFLALILVEVTDLIFAVDSIPAIFAITTDPFLVFTSNVFAILGLRSLYFALAGMIDRFAYLKVALSIVLMIVGVKMMTHSWLKKMLGENFNLYLLAVVLAVLAGGVVVSLLKKPKQRPDDLPGSLKAA